MVYNKKYTPKTSSGYRASGSGNFKSGSSGKPPRGVGTPKTSKGSGGCPLMIVFISVLLTAIKWVLVKRRL